MPVVAAGMGSDQHLAVVVPTIQAEAWFTNWRKSRCRSPIESGQRGGVADEVIFGASVSLERADHLP
jgi:hypothetical protein